MFCRMSIFFRFFRRKSPLTRLTNPCGMVYNKNTDRESANLTDDAPTNIVIEITVLFGSLGGYFFFLSINMTTKLRTAIIIITNEKRSPYVTYISVTSYPVKDFGGQRNILGIVRKLFSHFTLKNNDFSSVSTRKMY